MPFSNAKLEHMFWQMLRVKSDWSNRLGSDWLETLFRISEEGPSIDEWNPETAINICYNTKPCLQKCKHCFSNFIKFRLHLHVIKMKSHPGMKKIIFTYEFHPTEHVNIWKKFSFLLFQKSNFAHHFRLLIFLWRYFQILLEIILPT